MLNATREPALARLVGGPLELQRARLAQLAIDVERHVVEQLPQHAVAEAVVVQVHLLNAATILKLSL